MCAGLEYIEPQSKVWKVYFPSPKALLPVALSNGTVEWIKWGRRKEEKVILTAQRFMEKDAEKVLHWIEVSQGFAIKHL